CGGSAARLPRLLPDLPRDGGGGKRPPTPTDRPLSGKIRRTHPAGAPPRRQGLPASRTSLDAATPRPREGPAAGGDHRIGAPPLLRARARAQHRCRPAQTARRFGRRGAGAYRPRPKTVPGAVDRRSQAERDPRPPVLLVVAVA